MIIQSDSLLTLILTFLSLTVIIEYLYSIWTEDRDVDENNIGHMKKLLVINNVTFYSCQTEMPVPVSWINGQTDNT